jgi:hypothetical protein
MADLTAAKRKKLPARTFAGPKRSFPIPDKEHARLAISGATRSERAGNISAGEEAHIKAKARKKLGKGDPKENAAAAQELGARLDRGRGR